MMNLTCHAGLYNINSSIQSNPLMSHLSIQQCRRARGRHVLTLLAKSFKAQAHWSRELSKESNSFAGSRISCGLCSGHFIQRQRARTIGNYLLSSLLWKTSRYFFCWLTGSQTLKHWHSFILLNHVGQTLNSCALTHWGMQINEIECVTEPFIAGCPTFQFCI